MELTLNQIMAVVLGHAVGDALGVPAEFESRESLEKFPITDMVGFGAHGMPAGTWSDDTSMALCALESLAQNKVDFDDIMQNFCNWFYKGEFTATGTTFDAGGTCARAIMNYAKGKKSYEECGERGRNSNGNGSLMRIYPFVLYLCHVRNFEREVIIDDAKNRHATSGFKYNKPLTVIHSASALTHAHPRSKMACGYYAYVLWALLQNPCKDAVYRGIASAKLEYNCIGCGRAFEMGEDLLDEVRLIHEMLDPVLKGTADERDIKSFGYVLNTLQIAIWCLLTTNSYEECILKAVNLGSDADTNAAVAGSLAGALYGYGSIPKKWLDKLINREALEALARKAYSAWKTYPRDDF